MRFTVNMTSCSTTQACLGISPEDALVRFYPVVLFRSSSGVLQKPVENISGGSSCSADAGTCSPSHYQETETGRHGHISSALVSVQNAQIHSMST